MSARFAGFVCLLVGYSSCYSQKDSGMVRVYESFWPTRNVDPIQLRTAGDWSMLQNLYSNLVEMASNKLARPALAERWVQSPDGKKWTFFLRPGLRWSDGSEMTARQIVASLSRAHRGTTHTKLSSFVTSIRSEDVNRIEFELVETPVNFLISLAFVDSAIVHPQSYADGKFTWDAPSSGAFRVVSFGEREIQLSANPHYWEQDPQRIRNALLVRADNTPKDLSILMTGEWDVGQLAAGVVEGGDDIERLRARYEVFVGNPDFLQCLTFSKKRTAEGKLHLALRQYLLKRVYRDVWKGRESAFNRASGLRPPGTKGSLSVQEFDEVLGELKVQERAKFRGKLDVLVSPRFRSRAEVDRVLNAIRASGFELNEISLTGNDLRLREESGDFDLALNYLGASEADPDSAWRIYNSSYFAEPVASDAQLNQAQVERNREKRNRAYQEFERIAVRRALFIPIRNESTHIVTGKRIHLDAELAADWGLQLFKLRMRQ